MSRAGVRIRYSPFVLDGLRGVRVVLEPLAWPSLPRDDLLARAETAIGRPGARLVLLIGPSGVGKTHLLTQLLDRASHRGLPTQRVIGSEATARVPFGATLHLLPSPTRDDARLDLLSRAAAWIRRPANGTAPMMLGVDDPGALDDFSAALLAQAMVASPTIAVATVRTEELGGPRLRALLGAEGTERVHVGPLDATQTRELAERSLGGPVSPALQQDLWTHSQGVPLLVRELLTGAHEEGRLHVASGAWQVTGPIARSDRVVAIVGGRLQALGDPVRRALELVVLAEPLDLRTARRVATTQDLAVLEERGFVRVDQQLQRSHLVCAHPIYSEVVGSTLPELRRRAHFEALVAALEASPMRRIDDVVRAATWRLQCDLPVPPSMVGLAVLQALARFDFDLAQRLLRTDVGPDDADRFDIAFAQAVTLVGQGDRPAADQAFALARSVAATPAQTVRAVMAQGLACCWVYDDAPAGLALVARARQDAAGDPELVDELDALRAQLLLYEGAADEAGRAAVAVLARASPGRGARARALSAAAEAAALRADRATALARIAEATPLLEFPPLADPITSVSLTTAAYRAHLSAGDMAAARSILDVAISVLEQIGGPLFLTPMQYLLGDLLLHSGQPAAALETLAPALQRLPDAASTVGRPALLVLLVQAAAQTGELATARAAADELERLTTGSTTPAAVATRLQAGLWLARLDHDNDRAWAHAVPLADDAHRRGDVIRESAWLLEAALIDPHRAAVVRDRAAQLAAGCESPLIAAMAAAVGALADDSAPAMLQAADRLATAHLPRQAAELAAEAALRHGLAGDRAAAARAIAAAEASLARCSVLVPSPLARAAAYRLATFLTAREHEVASLAALGRSNREIAERLSVSVRTVENHLHRVFTKLNLRGRDDLRDLFRPGG